MAVVAERPVLVAPDAFGGGLRAAVAAGAIGRGLERAGLLPPDLCPLAGVQEALLLALGGECVGEIALLEDGGTAVIEHVGQLDAAVAAGARVVVLAGGEAAPPRPRDVRIVVPDAAFMLDALDFDARMRAARAVVTGTGRLDAATLRGGIVGEIGTRTRQAGVPLHAIVGEDALDPFGKRMVDLQVVAEAGTPPELEAAGEALGRALAAGGV